MTTLSDLASFCGGELIGDGEHEIIDVCSIELISKKKIAYVANNKKAKCLSEENDFAYVVGYEHKESIALGIVHENPTKAFRLILKHFYPDTYCKKIAETAVVSKYARLANDVTVGDYSIISDNVILSNNTVIGSHSIIHEGAVIGDNTRLGSHVVVHEGCKIGTDCVIADGVVVGGQGFGFSFEGGNWLPIPQIGKAIIGNHVHIGANSCIDRGAINDTIIGNNVIIDNLVHIAHNVEIGNSTAIAACVGVAGSTKIGKNCMLAGQVGVVGHIQITDCVQVYGGARVLRSIKEPGSYAGSLHALPVAKWNRMAVYIKKLETIFKKEKNK